MPNAVARQAQARRRACAPAQGRLAGATVASEGGTSDIDAVILAGAPYRCALAVYQTWHRRGYRMPSVADRMMRPWLVVGEAPSDRADQSPHAPTAASMSGFVDSGRRVPDGIT